MAVRREERSDDRDSLTWRATGRYSRRQDLEGFPDSSPERRAADDAIAARSGHRSRDSWSTQVSTGDNETEFEAAGPKKG